jgi:hypothetical protein
VCQEQSAHAATQQHSSRHAMSASNPALPGRQQIRTLHYLQPARLACPYIYQCTHLNTSCKDAIFGIACAATMALQH